MILCEFSIVPLGKGTSVSEYVAQCVRVVRRSGLPHQLTSMGTIVEGEWDEVIQLVSECHRAVRASCSRVLTTVRLDDREGGVGRLESKVRSVETKVSASG